MNWYALIKVVHFLGLTSLVGAFIIYPRVGQRLRAAATLHDARGWLGFLEITRGMFSGGVVMMLLSGLGMVAMRWRGPYAFVTAGMLVIIAIGAVYPFIIGRHLKAMRPAIGTSDGPVPADLTRVISTPTPWITMFVINFGVLGVLIEMTLKLGWRGASLLVVVFAVLGWFIGRKALSS